MIMTNSKINVLGTEYTVTVRTETEDHVLRDDADGYCDKTTKTIVLLNLNDENSNLGDKEAYMKKVLRHEITHAFFLESGLDECTNWDREQTVDWFAYQGLKIYEAWKKAGAI